MSKVTVYSCVVQRAKALHQCLIMFHFSCWNIRYPHIEKCINHCKNSEYLRLIDEYKYSTLLRLNKSKEPVRKNTFFLRLKCIERPLNLKIFKKKRTCFCSFMAAASVLLMMAKRLVQKQFPSFWLLLQKMSTRLLSWRNGLWTFMLGVRAWSIFRMGTKMTALYVSLNMVLQLILPFSCFQYPLHSSYHWATRLYVIFSAVSSRDSSPPFPSISDQHRDFHGVKCIIFSIDWSASTKTLRVRDPFTGLRCIICKSLALWRLVKLKTMFLSGYHYPALYLKTAS